jgi:hypothetical protein
MNRTGQIERLGLEKLGIAGVALKNGHRDFIAIESLSVVAVRFGQSGTPMEANATGLR